MTKLMDTYNLVKFLLESIPETRNSDDLLYLAVCRHRRPDINVGMLCFEEVQLHRKAYGLPPCESVRRSRQKVQQAHPELRACDDVEEFRTANEGKYRAFAQSVNGV